MFALIKHSSHGIMLFDTGYSTRFYAETQSFPAKFYAWTTPMTVTEADSAKGKLESLGISADQVTYVFISHFHADHVSGLGDFTNAKYVYLKEGYDAVSQLRGFNAARHGFIPGLIPEDFLARSQAIMKTDGKFDMEIALDEKVMAPFTSGIDLFGDQSLILVELPGHCAGHMGLLVHAHCEEAAHLEDFLLIGDACWHSKNFKELKYPHWATGLLIHSDWALYKDTAQKLHQLSERNPNTLIIAAHCPLIQNQLIPSKL